MDASNAAAAALDVRVSQLTSCKRDFGGRSLDRTAALAARKKTGRLDNLCVAVRVGE